jgi:hypothetical protein
VQFKKRNRGMSKRFTDTGKYDSPFFRSLKGPYKLLWDYLYHVCTFFGVWIVEFDIAQIKIGKDMKINKEDAIRYFNRNKIRIVEIDNGDRWFIPSFLEHQYKIESIRDLNKKNRVHKSVLIELKKLGLDKPLARGLVGCKDKDKDKDKEEEKEIIYPNVVKDLVDVYFDTLNEKQKKRFMKNIDKYWDVCDKLIRLDDFTEDEIRTAIINGRNDEFWRNNFLSFDKLRKKSEKMGIKYIEKFLTLGIQKSSDPTKPNPHPKLSKEDEIKKWEEFINRYEGMDLNKDKIIKTQVERAKKKLLELREEL